MNNLLMVTLKKRKWFYLPPAAINSQELGMEPWELPFRLGFFKDVEASDTLELESRALVWHVTRLLGTEHGAFARAAMLSATWLSLLPPCWKFLEVSFFHLKVAFDYQHQFLLFCLFSHWNMNGTIAISRKNSPCQKNLGKKVIYKPRRSRYNSKKMPLKISNNRTER